MLARLALVWAFCYLGFGTYQHLAAKAMAQDLAAARGAIRVANRQFHGVSCGVRNIASP